MIDFRQCAGRNNRFLAVRELKLTGLRAPHYNRRADLVCFVNGLPLVFIELKAVYKNIRAGFDDNLRDYLDENVIAHAFHHNAFLIVSNGDRARYGSITSKWEHFAEWKRNDEKDKGSVDAEVLLNGMLAQDRLLDLVENFILFDDSQAGRHAQGRGAQPSGARRQQRGGLGAAAGGTEAASSRLRSGSSVPRVELPEGAQAAEAPTLLDGSRADPSVDSAEADELPLVERAHPDLGRLGVFWHTQGSGKSYSMAFFAEKVRRSRARQLHVPADDRPRGSGRPDLRHLRRLRRRRRADAARGVGRGPASSC